MRYRSNLPMPDLTGFKLLHPPKQIMGHDAPSDPDFEPDCTFWTHDETAILAAIFGGGHMHGHTVVDIGARFGWTAKAINWATNGAVFMVDPHFLLPERLKRQVENTEWRGIPWQFAMTSEEYFRHIESLPLEKPKRGYVIDGNHDSPEPLKDAQGALRNAAEDCIIVFHDFWGKPIRDGGNFLMDNGFRCRVYNTPNGVACCWRGLPGWEPPVHCPDPKINWDQVRQSQCPEFDFSRCV